MLSPRQDRRLEAHLLRPQLDRPQGQGIDPETIRRLDRAVRILVRSGLNTSQALARIREDLAGDPEVDYLIAFVESAKHGVHKSMPRGGREGSAVDCSPGDLRVKRE